MSNNAIIESNNLSTFNTPTRAFFPIVFHNRSSKLVCLEHGFSLRKATATSKWERKKVVDFGDSFWLFDWSIWSRADTILQRPNHLSGAQKFFVSDFFVDLFSHPSIPKFIPMLCASPALCLHHAMHPEENPSSLCPSSSRLVSLSSPKNRFVADIRRKAFIFVLSASLSSGTRFPIDTTMSGFSKALWDGSDKTGFDSLEHPGYTMESNPDDFTGGWLAYRKVWEQETGAEAEEQPSDCWVKDIIGDITKVDYQSMEIGRAPRILVLYGSLRPTSFSRKAGRLLVA